MWKFINTYIGIPISVVGILVGLINLPTDLHSIFSFLPDSIANDWARLSIGTASLCYFVFFSISWLGREDWKPYFLKSRIGLADAAKRAYQELYSTSAGLIPEITFSDDPLLYYLIALTTENDEIYGTRFVTGVEERIGNEELVGGVFVDGGNAYEKLEALNPTWINLKISSPFLKNYIKHQKKRDVIKDVRRFTEMLKNG